MRNQLLIIILGVVVLILGFFRSPWGGVLAPQPGNSQDLETLRIENLLLKNELAKIQDESLSVPTIPVSGKRAAVFSRYPFSAHSEFLIQGGQAQGFQVGDAVILPWQTQDNSKNKSGVLIGKLTQVYTQTSLVQTILDPNWKSAVRVGLPGADALLIGGANPRVRMIPKTADASSQDLVYSVDKILPYGLAVGELDSPQLSSDQVFMESNLRLPYDLGQVNAVIVLDHHVAPK